MEAGGFIGWARRGSVIGVKVSVIFFLLRGKKCGLIYYVDSSKIGTGTD